MSYDSNWPRWVQASVANHFKTAANAAGYVSLVEELEEKTDEFLTAPNRVEIRVNGPFAVELSHNYWSFYVPCNMLIFSHMDGSVNNVYGGVDIAGTMAARATEPVSVLKYGNNVGDDQSFLFCLTVQTDKKNGLNVYHFGEIDSESRLRQYGVDFDLFGTYST